MEIEKCGNCGEPLEEGKDKCIKCGWEKLKEGESEEWYCFTCGWKNLKKTHNCARCGAPQIFANGGWR